MKRLIKLTYVVAMPLMILTLDILLAKEGKWNEMWDDKNVLLFMIFGFLHIAITFASLLFYVGGKDVTLIPSLKWEWFRGFVLPGIMFDGNRTVIIFFIGCIELTFNDGRHIYKKEEVALFG